VYKGQETLERDMCSEEREHWWSKCVEKRRNIDKLMYSKESGYWAG
jgi:hypothetical protein